MNTPDMEGRELFEVLVCPLPEFMEILPHLDLRPEGVEKDAWKMRENFLNLPEDVFTLQRFLNRWGLWDSGRGYQFRLGHGKPPGFILEHPHYLWKQREMYRKALAGKPIKWLATVNNLGLSQADKPPYFLVNRSYCAEAIKATITIDHLGAVTFRICKRDDCRKIFERTTGQKKLYCTTECAHLANVRKWRAQKKAESKRKGASQNAKS
jgi:hypothetical protein